jgi:hypothetical protein
MANEPTDYAKMSLADLRAAAEAELAALKGTPSAAEALGTTAPTPEPEPATAAPEPVAEATPEPEVTPAPEAATPAAEPEVAPAEPPAKKSPRWSRTIVAEDGSTRTISADTKDELIERLAAAHEALLKKHTTLKKNIHAPIKAEEITAAPLPAPNPASVGSPEELAQEILTNPSDVVSRIIKAQLGLSPEELRKELEEARRARAEAQNYAVTQGWIQSHPEYIVSPKNGVRMMKLLNLYGLQPTYANLERVYDELTADGLLELRKTDAAKEAAPTAAAAAPAASAAEPVADAPVTRTVVGSERRPVRTGVPVANAQMETPSATPDPAKLYKMSLKELRALAETERAALTAAQRP